MAGNGAPLNWRPSADAVAGEAMITTAATPTPQTVVTGIIDGDGHIRERDEDLYPY